MADFAVVANLGLGPSSAPMEPIELKLGMDVGTRGPYAHAKNWSRGCHRAGEKVRS